MLQLLWCSLWTPLVLRSAAVLLVARLLLETTGPLPQYHPSFLKALLLAGKFSAAANILWRLCAWVATIKANLVSDGTSTIPTSPALGQRLAFQGYEPVSADPTPPLPGFSGRWLACNQALGNQLRPIIPVRAFLCRSGGCRIFGQSVSARGLVRQRDGIA